MRNSTEGLKYKIKDVYQITVKGQRMKDVKRQDVKITTYQRFYLIHQLVRKLKCYKWFDGETKEQTHKYIVRNTENVLIDIKLVS